MRGKHALVVMTTGLVDKEEWKECYLTIQNELEEAEQLKFQYHDLQNKYDYEHNVLKICKDKKVNVFYIWLFTNYKEYNAYIDDNFANGDEFYLTEEEFNLIKGCMIGAEYEEL